MNGERLAPCPCCSWQGCSLLWQMLQTATTNPFTHLAIYSHDYFTHMWGTKCNNTPIFSPIQVDPSYGWKTMTRLLGWHPITELVEGITTDRDILIGPATDGKGCRGAEVPRTKKEVVLWPTSLVNWKLECGEKNLQPELILQLQTILCKHTLITFNATAQSKLWSSSLKVLWILWFEQKRLTLILLRPRTLGCRSSSSSLTSWWVSVVSLSSRV